MKSSGSTVDIFTLHQGLRRLRPASRWKRFGSPSSEDTGYQQVDRSRGGSLMSKEEVF